MSVLKIVSDGLGCNTHITVDGRPLDVEALRLEVSASGAVKATLEVFVDRLEFEGLIDKVQATPTPTKPPRAVVEYTFATRDPKTS